MNTLDTISAVGHNDRIAALVIWALDRNAPITALGFHLSENTMRLFREMRSELHRGEDYSQEAKPCQCKRCGKKVKRANRQAHAA